MKKTIFISSTYKDLIPERSAIWDLLKKYNVNVIGMEEFGARKESPLETCLQEVQQADSYIGMIANRFGSIEESSNKSFTQLEYEEAVKQGKEILIYLINNEKATLKIENIDFGERHEALENFKQILQKRHTIDTFVGATDLVEKLKRRLDSVLGHTYTEVDTSDDLKKSIYYLERFKLMPKSYSGNEVVVKISIESEAFPLSRSYCDAFKLSFGEAIGIKIKIIQPEIDNLSITCLIIGNENFNSYFELEKNKEYTILGKLVFTSSEIEHETANFNSFSGTYYHTIELRGFNSYSPPKYDGKLALILKKTLK